MSEALGEFMVHELRTARQSVESWKRRCKKWETEYNALLVAHSELEESITANKSKELCDTQIGNDSTDRRHCTQIDVGVIAGSVCGRVRHSEEQHVPKRCDGIIKRGVPHATDPYTYCRTCDWRSDDS